MTELTCRPYAGPHDLDHLIALLRAARSPAHLADYPGVIDLREMLDTPDFQANTCLWEDAAGRVIGFAILDLPNLAFEAAPGPAQAGVEDAMIAWAIAQARAAGEIDGEPPRLDTSCGDHNAARLALLEKHGFAREPECGLHFVRPLDEPIPAPELPPGFTIQTAAGEHQAERWVALHRAAWGTENMTVDYRLAMTRVPDYDPGLDLVAVAPDGTWAAYCFCYISREENALTGRKDGYTDPIATHPDFQGRGLAVALIRAGLERLKRRGMTMARTGTSSQNIAMQRVAQRAGFRLDGQNWWFSRPVDPR